MNNQEYIIINKTVIQKRIEELRQVCNKELGYASDKIYFELEHLLSQSTPLIPVIEKAILFGHQEINPWSNRDIFISNLKLDI